MQIDEISEKLLILLNDVKNEIFTGDNKIGYYCGREYTTNDFKNMMSAVDRLHKHYKTNSRASYKYIEKHKEYNTLMNKQRYYRKKPFKTSRDFEQLEEIAKQLVRVKQQIQDEKNDESVKILKERKRIELDNERRKELFDKYGFIDDLNQ